MRHNQDDGDGNPPPSESFKGLLQATALAIANWGSAVRYSPVL